MADGVATFTAIMGGYDEPRPPVVPGRHVLFTDGGGCEGWQTWTVAPGQDPRRAARQIKLTACFAPASVWLDGNIALVVPAAHVAGEWLGDSYDIALFRHPGHDCAYAEAKRVIAKGKDSREVVEAQVKRYREAGFPAHYGLGETCIIARRDCAAVREFMARWWVEVETGSVRDQLSFDYVRWLMGDRIRVNLVDGGPGWRKRQHPWFACKPHEGG